MIVYESQNYDRFYVQDLNSLSYSNETKRADKMVHRLQNFYLKPWAEFLNELFKENTKFSSNQPALQTIAGTETANVRLSVKLNNKGPGFDGIPVEFLERHYWQSFDPKENFLLNVIRAKNLKFKEEGIVPALTKYDIHTFEIWLFRQKDR